MTEKERHERIAAIRAPSARSQVSIGAIGHVVGCLARGASRTQ